MGKHGAIVDSVSVRVRPDTTQFAMEMRRITERSWTADVEVMLSSEAAKRDLSRFTNVTRCAVVDARMQMREARAELDKFLATGRTIDINARIDEKNTHIAELEDKLRELSATKTELKAKLKLDTYEPSEKVLDLKRNLASIEDTTVRLKADQTNAKETIAHLKEHLATIRDKKVTVKADIDDATEKMKDLERRLKSTQPTKVEIDAQTEPFRKKIAQLKTDIDQIDKKKLRVKADISDVTAKMKTMRAEMLAAGKTQAQITANTAPFKKKIAELQAKLAGLDNNKATIQVDIKDAELKMRELQEKLEKSGKTQIEIDAELAPFKQKIIELRKKLDGLTNHEITIKADVAKATEDLATVQAELKELRDKKIEVKAEIKDVSTAENKARLEELNRMIEDASKREIEAQVNVKQAKEELRRLTEDRQVKVEAEAQVAMARERLRWLTRQRVVKVFAQLNSTEFMVEMRKMMMGMSGMTMIQDWAREMSKFFTNLPQHTLSLAKWSTVIGGAASVVGSFLGTMAPLGRTIADIGPAALFTIPALTGATAAVGVLYMAFKNLADSGVPQAKEFFRVWSTFKDDITEIKKHVQAEFFSPAFIGSFKNLSKQVIPELNSGMGLLASTMGRVASHTMDAWGKALDGKAMTVFFGNLSSGFEHADRGFQGFISGLATMATKGSEVFPLVGDWFTKMGDKFNNWVNNHDIAKMMHDAAIQGGYLIDVVENLGGVIAGVFHAMDTGKSTGLESAAKTMGTIRDIVNADKFQTAMKTVFSGAADGAESLRKVLVPIGDSLAALSPLLGDMLGVTGLAAASVLKDIAAALAQPGTQSGIEAGLRGVADLARNIPWDTLGAALGSLMNLFGDMAPMVGSIVRDLAPLLPSVVDAVDALVEPLSDLASAVLPPLVGSAQLLLSIAAPLAPALLAVGAGFLTWKGLDIARDALSAFIGPLKLLGPRLKESFEFMSSGMKVATDFNERMLVMKTSVGNVIPKISGFISANAPMAGVTLAVGAIAMAWENMAKKIEKTKQGIEQFKNTLDVATGAITDQTKTTLIERLMEQVKPSDLQLWGTTYAELAKHILDGRDSAEEFRKQIIDNTSAQDLDIQSNAKLRESWQKLNTLMEGKADTGFWDSNANSEKALTDQLWKAIDAKQELIGVTDELNNKTSVSAYNTDDAARAMLGLSGNADRAKTSIFGLDDAFGSGEKSVNEYKIHIHEIIKGLAGAKAGWTDGTDAALKNRDTMYDQIEAAKKAIDTNFKQGKTSAELAAANKDLEDTYRELVTEMDGDVNAAMTEYAEQVKNIAEKSIAERAEYERVTKSLQSLQGQQFAMAAANAVASGTIDDQRDALIKAGKQAGLSADEVNGYIEYLKKIPKDQVTDISVNGVQAALDKINGVTKPRTVPVTIQYTGSNDPRYVYSATGGMGPHVATGGSIWGPGTGTSDSIHAMLSNGEFVVRAAVASKFRSFLSYLNATGQMPNLPRFATGGSVAVPNLAGMMRAQMDGVGALMQRFAPVQVTAVTVTPSAAMSGDANSMDSRVVSLLQELVSVSRGGHGLSEAAVSRAIVDLIADPLNERLVDIRDDERLGV